MHRRWFKVWELGQPLDSPVPVDDLPRRVHIVGHVAARYGRGRVLTAVYVLASSAEQAQQLFEETRDRLLTQP